MTEEDVRGALRWVIDPELGLNIVEMGLVYHIGIDGSDVKVQMTMTSPACPSSVHLTLQAESAVRTLLPDVGEVDIDLVWTPPWEPSMIAEEARRLLGW